MSGLRRHQLAYLSEIGWQGVLAQEWPQETQRCLQTWQDRELPWVVTRQPAEQPDSGPQSIRLGLPTPSGWGRQLLSVSVCPEGLCGFSEFPQLHEAIEVLPRSDWPAFAELDKALRERDVVGRVYGSVGWQWITGMDYLHPRSDVDVWLAVNDARHADDTVSVLLNCCAHRRLDGELMFADGSAIAWREWHAWRSGQQASVLVKRLNGVTLQAGPVGEEAPWAQAA